MSYYTTYNKEGEKVTIMDTDEGFLSLAYRELIELPRECIARLEHVQHLDLSNNKLSYPFHVEKTGPRSMSEGEVLSPPVSSYGVEYACAVVHESSE